MQCICSAIPRWFLRPTISTISPYPTFRHRTLSPAPAPATASFSSEPEQIRSPELVSREYADLNLSDKFCECPDPHFKKKHHKRRVVQKPLVESIVDSLVPGGQVLIQSDVLEVALDMREYFDAEDKLVHIDIVNLNMLCDNEGWLLDNPMGIRTEREIHAEFEGAKIYRRMYQK